MIYFTADQHFSHKNIITYCNRPFADTHEMNVAMTDRWNEVVKPEDTVYVLGDVTFNFKNIADIYSKLNGTKHLIRGNHDKGHDDILETIFTSIHSLYKLTYEEYTFILCHYPIQEWDMKDRGSIHLFGHVHNNPNFVNTIPNRYNVGVDVHNFYPVPITHFIPTIFVYSEESNVQHSTPTTSCYHKDLQFL